MTSPVDELVDIGGERFNVPAILRQLDSEIADMFGFVTSPKLVRRLVAAQAALLLSQQEKVAEKDAKIASLSEITGLDRRSNRGV